MFVQIYTPTNGESFSNVPHLDPHSVFRFFNFSHSGACVALSLYGFDLYFSVTNDVKGIIICLPFGLTICISSFKNEEPDWIFGLIFKSSCLFFSLLTCRLLHIFYIQTFIGYICIEIIFFYSVICLFTFLVVSLDVVQIIHPSLSGYVLILCLGRVFLPRIMKTFFYINFYKFYCSFFHI